MENCILKKHSQVAIKLSIVHFCFFFQELQNRNIAVNKFLQVEIKEYKKTFQHIHFLNLNIKKLKYIVLHVKSLEMQVFMITHNIKICHKKYFDFFILYFIQVYTQQKSTFQKYIWIFKLNLGIYQLFIHIYANAQLVSQWGHLSNNYSHETHFQQLYSLCMYCQYSYCILNGKKKH